MLVHPESPTQVAGAGRRNGRDGWEKFRGKSLSEIEFRDHREVVGGEAGHLRLKDVA
jgi:hypothetical protein